MIKGEGHGRVVDWWALGVLAYVLMAGRPPFSSDSREELTKKIAEADLDLENDERLADVSETCKDFIKRLLDKNPATRLGHAGADAQDVQQHPYFAGIDWAGVEGFKLSPPLRPALQRSTEPNNAQEIKQAHKSLADKIMRKHKSDGGTLDEGEYKPIQVNKFPTSNRVSIGLDFSGRNKKQRSKTWTGTLDDFGREITATHQ
ncbi:Serine/threonine protein kinase [Gracilaria domingensis]|nr:Serine/threonine protein kinase [Gracilaria domingensis]